MAVKKFRDISEMTSPRHEPGTRELYEVIRHVWGLSDRICPQRFPAGVFKHRSIEDAETLRQQWEDANFEAHRARGKRDEAMQTNRRSPAEEPSPPVAAPASRRAKS